VVKAAEATVVEGEEVKAAAATVVVWMIKGGPISIWIRIWIWPGLMDPTTTISTYIILILKTRSIPIWPRPMDPNSNQARLQSQPQQENSMIDKGEAVAIDKEFVFGETRCEIFSIFIPFYNL
jgi:hypothetical protein